MEPNACAALDRAAEGVKAEFWWWWPPWKGMLRGRCAARAGDGFGREREQEKKGEGTQHAEAGTAAMRGLRDAVLAGECIAYLGYASGMRRRPIRVMGIQALAPEPAWSLPARAEWSWLAGLGWAARYPTCSLSPIHIHPHPTRIVLLY